MELEKKTKQSSTFLKLSETSAEEANGREDAKVG
jgi:hypothetical protein